MRKRSIPLRRAIKNFEAAFWAGAFNGSGSKSSWQSAYLPYLRKLEQLGGEDLTAELLRQALESYPSATRGRQQCGRVIGMLARSAGLDLPGDWNELATGYIMPTKESKAIADDSAILDGYFRIPSNAWKLVYGLVATYGLRNYEPFFCDFSLMNPSDGWTLRVLPIGSSAARDIQTLNHDWIQRFDLAVVAGNPDVLPQVSRDLRKTTLQQVGRRVAEQFRRYDVGVLASDLRHSWALRAIKASIPDSVTARMMGIDIPRFVSEYQAWIDLRDQEYMRSRSWNVCHPIP